MVLGRSSAIAVMLCSVTATVAAEPSNDPPPSIAEPTERIAPTKWLFDAEAMAFIWLPLAGSIYANSTANMRSTPLWFDASEGGKTSNREYEIPGISLTLGGVGIIGGILLGDDPSRFYHAKGMAESMATSGFVTCTSKLIFGRHRPDYNPMTDGDEGTRSFPSGHSTHAFSALTYTALYLRYHGFDQWRPAGTLPAWEVATYAGLGALGVGFAGERVMRNRHNLSDVVAGSLLGTASSVAFFYWQERQYRKAKQRNRDARPREMLGLPGYAVQPAAPLPGFSVPVASFTGSF
jgi:hypothetical protein